MRRSLTALCAVALLMNFRSIDSPSDMAGKSTRSVKAIRLKVRTNGRYLVKEKGDPFFIWGTH
jgi:hypothetical protein